MVASVVGKIARKMVKSRNTKGKRTDLARERAERNLNKKRAEYKMTKAKAPPVLPAPKPITSKMALPKTKGGAKKLLKKYGVPASLIAGLLATRDTKKSEAKKVAAKPAAKSAAKSARKAGPSGPRMTSMKAPSTGPKPRNKNVTKRPRRPSGPSMTGFRK